MTTRIFDKIDGIKTYPGFVMIDHKLRYLNPEWEPKDDGPFTIELPYDNVALIGGDDGRRTKPSCPTNYRKFLAISKIPDRRVITTYLVYKYNGPVVVEAWDEEKKTLLADINMEHYDLEGDEIPKRDPTRLLKRHLERISNESDLMTFGLKDVAEKTFFQMLWNVKSL